MKPQLFTLQSFYKQTMNKKLTAISQKLNHVQFRLPIPFVEFNCPGVFLLTPKKISNSLPPDGCTA